MTKSTHNQKKYTQDILADAGKNSAEYPQYIKVWWWNYTDPSSLRLSKLGIEFIKKHTKIPIYECVLNEPLRNRTLIQLSRIFTCPYYIHKLDHFLLLGEAEYVMLKLHGDNLQQFLDNQQIS